MSQRRSSLRDPMREKIQWEVRRGSRSAEAIGPKYVGCPDGRPVDSGISVFRRRGGGGPLPLEPPSRLRAEGAALTIGDLGRLGAIVREAGCRQRQRTQQASSEPTDALDSSATGLNAATEAIVHIMMQSRSTASPTFVSIGCPPGRTEYLPLIRFRGGSKGSPAANSGFMDEQARASL
jgi:hypothetical protein